jgi:hypothetical protein
LNFQLSKLPWRSQQKSAETLEEYRFCKSFARFAIIKSAKTWLCSQPGALYFYIINNGSREKAQEMKDPPTLKLRWAKKEELLPRSAKLHPNKILRFFSYGKQSLEVNCFYRGPFFFYPLSP